MESGEALQRLQEAERPKDLHRVDRHQESHPRQRPHPHGNHCCKDDLY